MAWKSQQNSRKLKFSRALSFKILKKKNNHKQTWNSTQNQNISYKCGGKDFFRYTVQKNYLPNTLSQIPAGGYSPKFKSFQEKGIFRIQTGIQVKRDGNLRTKSRHTSPGKSVHRMPGKA